MSNSRSTLLLARLRCLEKQLEDLTASPDTTRGRIRESYVQDLKKLTVPEAVQYLTSVEESRVEEAYSILSERLHPAELTEICIGYMRRRGPRARLTGVLGIGRCLKRTYNKEASHALATIIRNPHEPEELRLLAYGSLELINWTREVDFAGSVAEGELFPLLQKDGPSGRDMLQAIDWSFVDSFL
jgi:hypothetical protein